MNFPVIYNFIARRGESRAPATSKMKCFMIIVNGFQPLTIITKHSILDAAAALDPPLICDCLKKEKGVNCMRLTYSISTYHSFNKHYGIFPYR